MGICNPDARVLWDARRAGVSFARTLLVGRQSLNLHAQELAAFRREHRAFFGAGAGSAPPLQDYAFYGYAEPFVREFLGAATVDVLDYSDYEGAQLIHDLNTPVPEAWHGRYDAVIDGGTLEHIFGFPTAIANLMRMVRPGGRLFLFLPANNLCGHGFYQFSPELMFRVFTEANGFALARLRLWEAGTPGVELTPARGVYDVRDPEEVGDRVGLMTRGPVTMIVEAEKRADVPLFQAPPLQSDYVGHWSRASDGAPAVADSRVRAMLKAVWKRLPRTWKNRVRGMGLKRRFAFSNRSHYTRVS